MTLAPETIRWFKDRRGIDQATLEAFGIVTEGEGVTIPYPDGAVKHRKSLEKDESGRHKMWFDPRTPDGRQRLFLPPNFSTTGKTKVVWEGETDTMAAWQNAPPEVQPHIAGIGGAGAFGEKGLTDEKIEEYFGDASLVFFVMDNEDPYESTEAYETVERAKVQIKQRLGRKAKFVSLPGNTQDGAEFFLTFDWAAFAELMKLANKVTYHFQAIDFTKPVPEYDWLVDTFLVRGDIALVLGDGGVGKSEMLASLAAKMILGEDEWLGMKVDGRKVMFVDQENPLVDVRQRMHSLGIRPEHAEYVRYIWYQNILLDNPEYVRKLYEDVEAFDPDLLILDSLSRMHLRNENANEEMNPLINGAIFPLSRTLGTTVAMIHHTAKAGGSRGATSIRNAVDICFDVTKSEDETWRVWRPDKERHAGKHWNGALYVQRREDDDGNVEFVTEEDVVIV